MANQPTSELPTVHEMDFHGDRLLLVDVDAKPQIVLRPALEALGLDYPTQFEKLRRRSWATVGQSPTVAADGRVREMVTVDVRTFLMLLATVDESRVSDAVRPKLVAYQAEVADAIEAYWTRGAAINPRATVEQLDRVIDLCTKQAAVLRALDGIVAPDWLEAKARHLAARALGEEPEVDPAKRPLTVGEYLEEKGIRGARLRKLSRDFGRWLKAEYRSEYGCNPPLVPRFVDGAERDVCGYTEAQRPLFDAIWSTWCAESAEQEPVVDTPIVRLSDAAPCRRGRQA